MGPSRSCWNGTTSVLQPEEITSKGARVSCVYSQEKCPYVKSLETYRMHLVAPRIQITIGITVTFMFQDFFSSLVRPKYLTNLLFSFIFIQWLTGTAKFYKMLSSFLVNPLSSGRDWMTRIYLKVSENFMYLIFKGGFCILLIPFVSIVKLPYFAQLPKNHQSHPIIPDLTFLLVTAAFIYNVINHFISITTLPPPMHF